MVDPISARLKILIVCQEYPPGGSGIANLVFHLSESLRKLGHKVDICSPQGPTYTINAEQVIKKYGGLGIAYFWKQAALLIDKKASEYDIVYLHNPLLFRKIKHKNIRCVVHTLYYHAFINYAYKKIILWPYYFLMILLEKITYYNLRTHPFIVTSPETIKELSHYGITRKIPIIFNGVTFTKKTNYLLPEVLQTKKKKLLFVGRFDIQKNLFRLLDTFHHLDSELYQLFIVGSGAQEKSLKKHVAKHNIKGVHFLNKIEHEQLSSVYEACDYFVMSSHYEGFPLVLSEATGHGLIPLLSPLAIFKYIQKKLGVGLIVDYNKPEIAAQQINEYCSNINLEKESYILASKARKLFSWDAIAQDYIATEKHFTK